jgi:cyclase
MSTNLNYGRLIPLLTINQGRLVKTRRYEYLKYLGDPVNAVSMFGKFEVDELIVIDLTHNASDIDKLNIAKRLSNQALMPIAYGGGIRNYNFCEDLFNVGFDKIILREKLSDSDFLKKLSNKYGKQAITGCIDVSLSERNNSIQFNDVTITLEMALEQIKKITNASVGEIMLSFKELDGTRLGLPENAFIEKIEQIVNCPIVIAGGCKSKEEALDYMKKHKKFSVAASSIFTLQPPNDAVLIKY